MVETRPFKTKLCVLYQRGRCVRDTCTFAHGDYELRGFSDRQINRDNDLRSKLDRKRSPLHRSTGRDAEGLQANKRSSPSPTSKRRKTRTHEHVDGPYDISGRLKTVERSVDSRKDKRLIPSNSGKMIEDEVQRIQYEVDVLSNQNSQLEIEVVKRVQEAEGLSSQIRDLEAQLSVEKDKIKRVNSKIEKFIRVHTHHFQLQDKIKRSQIQLDQLVGELGIDAIQTVSGSDQEALELKKSASPARKQLHNSIEATQVAANTARRHEERVVGFRKNHYDCHGEAEMGKKRKNIARTRNENKPQLQNNAYNASRSLDHLNKLKASELNLVAPSTSMAAHADDDFDLIEAEENPGVVGTPKKVDSGLPFPIPPLPAVSQHSQFQYEGDDENVDVDGVEELEEVDIV